jgi:hypothetical protein
MIPIKFRQYYVANDLFKAKVSYHMDGRIDKRKCVTIYARDWCRNLRHVFQDGYINESDMMTDYFEQGRVVLFEDNKHYPEARKVAEMIAAKREAKRQGA